MGRQSKKQIKAQLINEVAKTYVAKLQRAQDIVKRLGGMYHTMKITADKLKEENLKLQEKVEQQEDWIRRLQEFMDMDNDTRQEAIAEYRVSKQFEGFSHIMNIFETMLYKF